MRILLVHNRYLERGGEDVVFEAESALLREHGHEVTMWEEDNAHLEGQPPISSAVNAIWSSASQKHLQELIRQHHPTVVHFHNTFLRVSPAAYYTCQEAGIPVVQTLHNYRLVCPSATLSRDGKICEDCLGKWGLWPSVQHKCWHSSRSHTAVVATMLTIHRLLKTWQKQVNVFIALTEFARQKFIAGGLPAEKIVVKPNFATPSISLPMQNSSRSPFALYVGRLSPEKGVALLIEAWQSLPTIPLKIVGDGPLREELETVVKRSGLNTIEFYGNRPQEEVFHLMESARFLVIPSIWYEGLPMTMIEAFSRSLPVIASQLGSLAEIVQHGENGIHFKPNDASDLAYWVNWAWENPSKMERIANKAYREFQEKYSASSNYQFLMDIYQKAIAQSASI